jgi:cell wall-associated NlpC family hydrolase
LFLCLLFVQLIYAESAYSLSIEKQDKVADRTTLELKFGAKYDWGENTLKKQFPDSWQAERLKPGAMGDCSGKMQAIYYWAGLFVRRCTAADMAEGKYGWKGKLVSFSSAKKGSLIFFTFKSTRVNGHVGELIEDTQDIKNKMAHASQSHNRFMLSPVNRGDEGFYSHIQCIRELD